MPTPDFEDWLDRQDIPIEETTTIEDYQAYLQNKLGIHGGSLSVSEQVYRVKYEILPDAGIKAVERVYEIAGEKFVETRYAITEARGLYGKISAYNIAEARMIEERRFGDAEVLRKLREDAESQPYRLRRRYED